MVYNLYRVLYTTVDYISSFRFYSHTYIPGQTEGYFWQRSALRYKNISDDNQKTIKKGEFSMKNSNNSSFKQRCKNLTPPIVTPDTQ